MRVQAREFEFSLAAVHNTPVPGPRQCQAEAFASELLRSQWVTGADLGRLMEISPSQTRSFQAGIQSSEDMFSGVFNAGAVIHGTVQSPFCLRQWCRVWIRAISTPP